MEETAQQFYIPLRPLLPAPRYGFKPDVEQAADQIFQCWRLLLDEKPVGEIAEATGLAPQLISALADRFW